MAEGGFEEYENPEFDRDDYDMTEEELRSLNESQQAIDLQMEDMQHQDRETLENTKKMVINEKLDSFIDFNERKGGEPLKPAISICSINKDKLLCIQDLGMDKEVPLEYKRGGLVRPYSLSFLEKKYGMAFIRDTLGFVDYKRPAEVSQADFTALAKVRDTVNTATEEIPMQDFTETTEVRTTVDAANEIETSFRESELPDVANVRTQTEGITFRELQGLDEALRRTRGELANNLAKLTDLDREIAKERRKLGEAEDEISKRDIKARLKNLEDERGARLEAASANKEALRSQINRIKETINKVLKEDTTLGERIKTLFREQGITIVSVLTAFGMIIGVIVEAFIPTTGGTVTPAPPPKDGSGVKDWIKKTLQNLGKLLASLAGKAAAALPGIIGSIVSWLLSATGKVVNWFGNNLWALVVAVAGLLYVAASEYISKSHR